MTIDISPGVLFGYGTIVEIWAHGDNRLEIGPGVRVLEGARIELRGGTIKVGASTMVHDNAVLKSDGVLSIGANSRISYGSCLHCSDRMDLADWTGLAEYVTIADSDHTPDGTDVPNNRRPIATEPVEIERNVFFGRGAVVLRGARIGPNSAVGANAVVRRGEYPGGWLLAGNPAKPVLKLGERQPRGTLKPPTHPE
jgi:acetyltransferase-like isoleucine patch superfamily enzyme